MRRYALPKYKVHPGIPTMKRIRKAILGAGMALSDGMQDRPGYVVDRKSFGFIRIRYEDYGKEEQSLSKLLPILSQRFAAVLMAGTGNYRDHAEILVTAKPLQRIEGCISSIRDKKAKSRNLVVAQTMIREDVWQAICQQQFKSWMKEIPQTVEGFRDQARKLWVEYEKELKEPPSLRMLAHKDGLSAITGFLQHQFVVGLKEHFDFMVTRHPSEAERNAFLDTVGELCFIQFILAQTRYQWRPSASCGPQFGEWALHASLLQSFADIALKEVHKESEEE